MLYASRYLAESNYFGEEAMFKVYQFASNEEQEKYIVEAKQNLPKREYDKLKYHKGRLVVYKSYHNHLQEYPRWDSPFVVENNAIQIYVKILGEPWIVSIQRRLIIYFLEDALFSKKKESNGIALLQNYLPHHQRDVRNGLFVFKTGQTNNLSTKEMSNLRKLFPRKLIQSYLYEDNTGDMDSPSQVLSDTSINDTEKKGTKKILNLRVGKHLKLRYIRKVWNLIYFKDIYKDQAQRMGHHKKFHITKDEFVFYTRWMYSFESIPSYKDHLIQFFIKKHFFNNEEFKELFLNSSSIDELYLQTKRNFIKWSAHNVNSEKKEKTYSLEDYKLFFESKILYINVSHFISFLNQEKVIQKNDNGIIQYKALKNLSYLIKPFYYKDKLEIEHYKTYGKVFNKLRSIKLEDCLLYEIAYRYLLNVTPSFPKYKQLIIQSFPKEKVDLLVNAIYSFEIHNKKGAFIYSIQVPFLKLNELVCLIYRNSTKIAATNKEFLFLQIYKYLVNYCKNKPVDYELYTVCYKFNQLKVLGYDDLLHFLKHIVKRGLQLTQILTQLEKFLIIKNNIQIDIQKQGTLNSLSIYECSKMNNPQKLEDLRIKAINFDIPDTDYPSILEHIEKQFIIKEITPFKPVSWSHLEKHTQDMCDIMMNMLHLNLYKRNSDTESREEAKIQFRDRYFNTVVKQSD